MTEYRERILPEIALLNLKISSNTTNLVESSQVRALEESIRADANNERFGSSLGRLEMMAEREAKCEFEKTNNSTLNHWLTGLQILLYIVRVSGLIHRHLPTGMRMQLHDARKGPQDGYSNIHPTPLGHGIKASMKARNPICGCVVSI
jgi:hypothetical protein